MQKELEEKDKLIQKVASVVTQQPKKAQTVTSSIVQ